MGLVTAGQNPVPAFLPVSPVAVLEGVLVFLPLHPLRADLHISGPGVLL